MKVNSNIKPNRIQENGEYIWLRKNIEEKQIQEEERTYTSYFYDEIVLKNIKLQTVKNKFEDIFKNPQNYNVIQINGRYISDRR
ncbi:hypothetical protein [Oceanotoga phage vB_OteS-UFV02]